MGGKQGKDTHLRIRTGTLYVVSTPIGNLDDITLRAIKTLRAVSLIAAEDTRRARVLLGRYSIKTPVTSFFEHNELRKKGALIKKLERGEDIALISEAGTPGVSDPGFRLLRDAVALGVSVSPVPGPSALLAALSVSGLPSDTFHFFGFLPPKGSKRRRRIDDLKDLRGTIILYEAPHRLDRTLMDLYERCGDREVVVARELTKIHEEIIRGPLLRIAEAWSGRAVRGEITVLMAGRGKGD